MMLGLFLILAVIMLQVYTQFAPDYYNPELTREYLHLKEEIEKTVELSILNEEDISSQLLIFENFAKNYYAPKQYQLTMNYDTTDQSNIQIDLRLQNINSYLEDTYTISRMIS